MALFLTLRRLIGMNRLAAKLNKINFKNPVTVASGTFGAEYSQLFDLNQLGAVVTKTITKQAKQGNPPPRLVETPSGLINSIGLQNPGLEHFCKHSLNDYRKLLDKTTPLIVSFSGQSVNEFVEIALRLDDEEGIAAYEVNISCPNVEKEGLCFGIDPASVFELTSKLHKAIKSDRELIIKLTPNVNDITVIAQAAADGGCDSLALINTLLGMKINWETGKTSIGKGFGGLSGPAIMPVALYNVFRVSQKVDIPILAMGGITTYQDALEFIYAGASAIAVGTANFINPLATLDIIKGLEDYVTQRNISIDDIKGKVIINS
jgi:dihydroorotate dehydrogenase (NAD+) catalytic subunit